MTRKQKLGQHLLEDPHLLQHLVDLCQIEANNTVVEIGPGKGALTQFICHQCQCLHLVELDREFYQRLCLNYSQPHITIHHCDILRFNWNQIPSLKIHIIGNLPYYISSPILIGLTKIRQRIDRLHFMLQREVGLRLMAKNHTKAFGRLSVLMQTLFDMESLMDLPPHLFNPPPKVDSVFIRLTPKVVTLSESQLALLESITQLAFGQRRKTLRNNLKTLIKPDQWSQLNIDPNARAEDLSVADFHHICRFLSDQV